MANTTLKADIIANEALMLLDNNLVMGNLVHRGYEDEFDKSVNGYRTGSTVRIRKPAKFTVRAGATASSQDVVEGHTTVTVGSQIGVDFQFTSQELTLDIRELSERVLKSAMIPLANQIDADIHRTLYRATWNYVGTPGTALSGFASFGRAPQRMTEMAVPQGARKAVLSPADNWGMLGNTTGLYIDGPNKTAFQEAKLGRVGGVDIYESQNVVGHTVGTKAGTPLVNGPSQNVTITTTVTGAVAGVVKDVNAQTLITDGWSNASNILKQGDVITIAGVFAVNPVTKATLSYLQQFVVNADYASDGSGNATISISPAIITSGAFQTVSAPPADNAAITVLGTASTTYYQNLVFDQKAAALVVVPMDMPQGVVDAARQTYKGLSARLVPYYDGTNDISKWRLDILYGVKAIYPDLACRLGG